MLDRGSWNITNNKQSSSSQYSQYKYNNNNKYLVPVLTQQLRNDNRLFL